MPLPVDFEWEPIDEVLTEAAFLGGGALHFMSTYGCIYHLFHRLCQDRGIGLTNDKTVFCPSEIAFNIACTVEQSGFTYQHLYQRWCEANTTSGRYYDTLRKEFHNLLTINTQDGVFFNPKILAAYQAAASSLAKSAQEKYVINETAEMESLIRSAEATLAQRCRTDGTGNYFEYMLNEFKIWNLDYDFSHLWVGFLPKTELGDRANTIHTQMLHATELQRYSRGESRFVDAGRLVPQRFHTSYTLASQFANGPFNLPPAQMVFDSSQTPIKFEGIPSSFVEYARAMAQMQFLPIETVKSLIASRRPRSRTRGILSLEEARRDNRRVTMSPQGLGIRNMEYQGGGVEEDSLQCMESRP